MVLAGLQDLRGPTFVTKSFLFTYMSSVSVGFELISDRSFVKRETRWLQRGFNFLNIQKSLAFQKMVEGSQPHFLLFLVKIGKSKKQNGTNSCGAVITSVWSPNRIGYLMPSYTSLVLLLSTVNKVAGLTEKKATLFMVTWIRNTKPMKNCFFLLSFLVKD